MAQYVNLREDQLLPEILDLRPYKAVVLIERPVSEAQRAAVSRDLCASGCLYMMAWGENCSAWDSSVDLENLKQFGFSDIPEGSFVMTTWHENESIDDVFWYAKNCAFHPTVELAETLIVHFGDSRNRAGYIRRYEDA